MDAVKAKVVAEKLDAKTQEVLITPFYFILSSGADSHFRNY